MKFKTLDKFIEQKQKIEQSFSEMAKREQAALEAYHAKKVEYEVVIARSVTEGKDLTKELDLLDEEISQAKAVYSRRKKEREVYSEMRLGEKLSAEDVVASFNTEFIPAFKEKRFDPVLKRLLKAKYEFAEAVQDYHNAVKEFENIRSGARSELSDHYYYKLQTADLQTRAEVERYFITASDLFDMDGKQFPTSLKNVKPEEIN